MSDDEQAAQHVNLTVSGGSVHIGNASFGTKAIAINVTGDQPGLIRADDGVLIDPDRLRRAVEDLTTAVRLTAGQSAERQEQLVTELRQAVTQPQPQRSRALEILGRFADGSATGEVVFAAVGAVLGVLGAQ